LVADLKHDCEMKGRKTWCRREQHIAHLRPFFGGMRIAPITSSHLSAYADQAGKGSSGLCYGEPRTRLPAPHDDARAAAFTA
jgi:hypothetical protein